MVLNHPQKKIHHFSKKSPTSSITRKIIRARHHPKKHLSSCKPSDTNHTRMHAQPEKNYSHLHSKNSLLACSLPRKFTRFAWTPPEKKSHPSTRYKSHTHAHHPKKNTRIFTRKIHCWHAHCPENSQDSHVHTTGFRTAPNQHGIHLNGSAPPGKNSHTQTSRVMYTTRNSSHAHATNHPVKKIASYRQTAVNCCFFRYDDLGSVRGFIHIALVGSLSLTRYYADPELKAEIFKPQQWATWHAWGGVEEGIMMHTTQNRTRHAHTTTRKTYSYVSYTLTQFGIPANRLITYMYT